MFSTAAAVIISAVIGLLFISAYITAQIGDDHRVAMGADDGAAGDRVWRSFCWKHGWPRSARKPASGKHKR